MIVVGFSVVVGGGVVVSCGVIVVGGSVVVGGCVVVSCGVIVVGGSVHVANIHAVVSIYFQLHVLICARVCACVRMPMCGALSNHSQAYID